MPQLAGAHMLGINAGKAGIYSQDLQAALMEKKGCGALDEINCGMCNTNAPVLSA